MNCSAWFHCWADGQWQRPLAEFRDALGDFDGPVYLGLVGMWVNCMKVIEECPDWTVVASEREGFEAHTLNALREFAQTDDGAVIYAHTKGAATVEPFRDRWRGSMLNRVVKPWRENLAMLERGATRRSPYGPRWYDEIINGPVDAVGTHWLTEEGFPGMLTAGMTDPAPGSGFFGGNFWMARCDYLRTLPECPAEPRWQAESWIGWGHPRVVDLLPGWPHDNRWPELCG